MFTIDKNIELTTELLEKMINRFVMNEQPKLIKRKNYYDGKHQILNKTYKDKTKTCNRIVTNFCKVIVDAYGGYICGKPISYTSNEDISAIQEVINYNDANAEDVQLLTDALIYGVAYELQWLDSYSQVRFATVNPMNAFCIYDNTLDKELLYFVRWYKEDNFDDTDVYYFNVYSKDVIRTYKSSGISGALSLVDEQIHYHKDVPVSVFKLNEDGVNIFDNITTLNDAYNELISCEVDDYSGWCDAYLTLTSADINAEDIQTMKENRVLVLPEGASASWLTKNASNTQIVNMLDNIKKNIYRVANCPDMSDENFAGGVSSGVSISFKLTNFENVSSGIVARMTKAIQRRIELISNILELKATDTIWRDINISFTRNLPVNTQETVQLVNSLHGIVSDKTLLAQIPFVDDVECELEALQKQKEENMAIYSFGTVTEDDEDGEEE